MKSKFYFTNDLYFNKIYSLLVYFFSKQLLDQLSYYKKAIFGK